MKKVILSLFAVAALASCVQTEELGVANNMEAIAFDNAFVDNATKSIDPSITTGSITSFKVYGTTKSLDNGAGTEVNIFNGVDVSKNGTGAWSYSNDHIQYWIADNEYKFAAVVNGAVNTDAVGLPATIDYTADGATDLLYAYSEVVGKASDNSAVKFTFNHLLAKAKFTVHNTIATNTADNEVTYRVSDVKINAYASATYNVENGAWVSQAGTFATAFGHIDNPVTEGALLAVDGTVAVKGGHKADSHNARLLIPGAYDALNITCKIETLLNGKVVDVVNYNNNVNITLAKGTSYNFVLSLGNPGDVVEFDVKKVEGWLPDVDLPVYGGAVYVSNTAELKAAVESDQVATIVLQNDINLADHTRAVADVTLTVKSGKELTLDLNGHTISAVDNSTGHYALITNQGNLSIVGPGSIIILKAENNRGWNAYSSVISNTVGGNLVVDGGVVIEHRGGTDMAYAIDNLTNGRGTKAVATIKSATLKSTYRAVRQFLNGTEAFNELYVKAGAVIETTGNKAIWMQSPSNNANSGKLVVEAGAQLKNNVYVDAPAGAVLEVSVAESALVNGADIDIELPEGYALKKDENGVYSVVYDVVMVTTAEELAEVVNGATEDITVGLANDLSGKVSLTQNAGIDVKILGNGKKYVGGLHIWGNGASDDRSLTIKNVKFDGTGLTDDEGCIYTTGAQDGKNSYACNVTIEDCTFTGAGVAAIRQNVAGEKDWTIRNCTVDNTMHSLLQVSNTNGELIVEKCKVYSKNGANLNSTCVAKFTDCEFAVRGYAVRVGVNSGGNPDATKVYTFTNCKLKSQCEDGDAVVIVRKDAEKATLNFVDTTLEGTNTISGFTSETTVNGIELPQLNNQIWYTATSLVHAHFYKDTFGEGTDLVSNVWDETTGKGVITLSGDVTKIGQNAFYYDLFHDSRENLISISLPNTVTEIGEAAFDKCPNLTTVTFNNNLVTIGPGAFKGCAKLTNVVLPEGLVTIGDSAFNSCVAIKSITIPAGVTSIGNYAFNGISEIKVYCKPTTPPTVGSTPFNKWWAEIYVPTASLAAYQQAWGSVAYNICDGNF